MRLRMIFLLLVATVSGTVVGLAENARDAGPTAVEQEGARPIDETVAYVANVTTQWRKLVGCT
jgi:hypothetical protein